MIRRLSACLLALALSLPAVAQPITAADAQRDLRILKRALSELHPGAFRRITPAQLDAEFERAGALVAQGSDRATMYLLASRLSAAVRCGHTWTNYLNQSDAVKTEVFGRIDKLPLTLRLVAGRALIDGSAVAGLAEGAELLAVDGRDVATIVADLLPYLRADGDADNKRRAQIDHGANGGAMDRLFPLLHPPREGRYILRVRDSAGERELTVAATTVDARTAALAQRGVLEPTTDWTFMVRGDTAVLTLPTFGFWDSSFKWQAYLEDVFAQLQRRQVAYLIIDIRRNEGGDDAIGKLLLSHLLRKPYTQPAARVETAYERVPYVLARYLDTWDFGFFDRTGQVVKGEGRNWLLKVQPLPATLTPVAQPFGGRTLVLIGPENSSAGFLLARDIKATRAATLVGQPTAGSLRGLDGGELAWITLPASAVAVDIPLISGIQDEQPDTGVAPDVAVAPRFADAVAGIDTEMRVARRMIQQWRAKSAPR